MEAYKNSIKKQKERINKKYKVLELASKEFKVSKSTPWKWLAGKCKDNKNLLLLISFLKDKLYLSDEEVRILRTLLPYEKKTLYNGEYAKAVQECTADVVKRNPACLSKNEWLGIIKIRLRKANIEWKNVFGMVTKEHIINGYTEKELYELSEKLYLKPSQFREPA